MKIPVDVWLRGTDFATTTSIDTIAREPAAWVDTDVRLVLEGMLKAMHRLKHPGQRGPEQEQAISLRGLSWIVNPFDEGGVVIAIEITMGAAIAGPLNIEKAALEAMISRVLVSQPRSSESIH